MGLPRAKIWGYLELKLQVCILTVRLPEYWIFFTKYPRKKENSSWHFLSLFKRGWDSLSLKIGVKISWHCPFQTGWHKEPWEGAAWSMDIALWVFWEKMAWFESSRGGYANLRPSHAPHSLPRRWTMRGESCTSCWEDYCQLFEESPEPSGRVW